MLEGWGCRGRGSKGGILGNYNSIINILKIYFKKKKEHIFLSFLLLMWPQRIRTKKPLIVKLGVWEAVDKSYRPEITVHFLFFPLWGESSFYLLFLKLQLAYSHDIIGY